MVGRRGVCLVEEGEGKPRWGKPVCKTSGMFKTRGFGGPAAGPESWEVVEVPVRREGRGRVMRLQAAWQRASAWPICPVHGRVSPLLT